ncbi:MAG TPA: hypothetical protein VGO76_20935 [Luteibacter sp.]|nr:hypothetical protein [Luteibacter sp.]
MALWKLGRQEAQVRAPLFGTEYGHTVRSVLRRHLAGYGGKGKQQRNSIT